VDQQALVIAQPALKKSMRNEITRKKMKKKECKIQHKEIANRWVKH